ncbi:MAG: hypothetical protein KIT80_12055 [Chitinophagaceae bacterium]|nr:hypothetical protein [Chitinophagaceae bacterium]MCW5927636.1 hypothetical protein [Chitinophagaceae bacterium]
MVTVDDGIEIPISACVEANTKILGNAVDPVPFCKCLIPKFYQDLKNDSEKLKSLKEGSWYDLGVDKQEVVAKYFQSCITQTGTNDSAAKFTITPRMATGMKNKMKQELAGSDIEKTNDIDKYCDCIINSFQTDFTIKEIMLDNFNETKKYQKTVEKCLNSTKKN